MTRRDIERRLDDLEELLADGGDDGDDETRTLTDRQREHVARICRDAGEMPPDVRERMEAADDNNADGVREMTDQQAVVVDWLTGGEGRVEE